MTAEPSLPALDSFNQANGEFTIATGDKTLNGLSQTFTLTCSSPTSVLPGGVQTKTITIDYVDECLAATVSRPTISPLSYELDLYTSGYAMFSQVSMSIDTCETVYILQEETTKEVTTLDMPN